MNLPSEIFGDVIVVHTPDELGAENCDAFEAYVPSLERHNVVLDLDATEMIDSKGLTALLNVQDKLRDLSGEAKIATTNDTNRKIFETKIWKYSTASSTPSRPSDNQRRI